MIADTTEKKDHVFLILIGVWLFTTLFLFTNPVILDYLHPPKNIGIPTESLGVKPEDYSNAQSYIGILLVLGLACLLGLSRIKKPKFQLSNKCSKWIAWLPLIWFTWQLISAAQTVDFKISRATVIHFGSCIAAFYLGVFVLARMRLAKLALWGAALGLIINLIDASQEHFGGLEKTRNAIINQIELGELDPSTISPNLRKQKNTLPQQIRNTNQTQMRNHDSKYECLRAFIDVANIALQLRFNRLSQQLLHLMTKKQQDNVELEMK